MLWQNCLIEFYVVLHSMETKSRRNSKRSNWCLKKFNRRIQKHFNKGFEKKSNTFPCIFVFIYLFSLLFSYTMKGNKIDVSIYTIHVSSYSLLKLTHCSIWLYILILRYESWWLCFFDVVYAIPVQCGLLVEKT